MYNCILKKGIDLNPTGIAVVCDDKRFSYTEIQNQVIQYASELLTFGIKKGSKVVICINNPLKFVFLLFALEFIEAIPMPVYSKTGIEKIEGIISRYNINFALMSIDNNKLNGNCHSFSDKIDLYFFSNVLDNNIIKAKLVLFTSGTTNEPKAIMLSKENICSNVIAISKYLDLHFDDNILLIKDLSHSSSIIGELFVGLYNGCTIVLTTKLPVTSIILHIMEQESISVFFAVPTLLKGIMRYNKISKYYLAKLRIINFYGASMHQDDIKKLISIFEKVNIIYSYGQTEASPRITYIEKNDIIKYPGSCGRAIQDVDIRIVDSGGNEVPPGKKGEITITGPNVMIGYYMNEEKTKQVIQDNRLFTKDIGIMNTQGYLYVTGRMDNMIISAGKNIYPEEIEGVLATYESIVEALVVSEIKNDGTCFLKAYVVIQETKCLDNNRLFVFLRDNLENYKIPKEVVPVKKLERTASGKIKRRQSFLQ